MGKNPAVLLLVLALFIFPSLSFSVSAKQEKKILLETDTLYHHVTITQQEKGGHNIRCMVFAGKSPTNQSCIDLDDPNRQVLEYSAMVFASLLFQPNPRKILVVGMGGGVIPAIYTKLFPYAQVDVVEIDPKIVDMAKKYFKYHPGKKTKIFVKDGRRYIKRTKIRYDLILLDAYNGDQIPFHLMTKEFFEELKESALEKNGILVSNVWSNTQLFMRQMHTYKTCFAGVYPFVGKRSGNVIVVATRTKSSPTARALGQIGQKLQAEHKYPFFDLTKIAMLYSPTLMPQTEEKLLTDDYAPVNYLMKQK